jgi:glycosyltransferase involved in cell wall biosynthesis
MLTIAWRNPALFDLPMQSQFKFLWMHDTDAGPNITEERASKIDAVMALSDWHVQHLRELYPFLGDKCFVIGNGLDPERFSGNVERIVDRFVYASSPDRGLEQALSYWPKIREQLPEAEFHIYYGFDNFRRMRGPIAYEHHIMELAKQPGVVWRGRLGQQALAQELRRASVLFYPGPHPFCETYCITALEAQAAGCVPVTRDNGALPETNSRGVLVSNDAAPEEWVDAAVKATGTHPKRRAFLSDWAKTQTWDAVCERLVLKVRELSKQAA